MTTERRNAVMTFLRLAGTQFVTTILVRYWFVRLDGENSVVQPIVALTRTLFYCVPDFNLVPARCLDSIHRQAEEAQSSGVMTVCPPGLT